MSKSNIQQQRSKHDEDLLGCQGKASIGDETGEFSKGMWGVSKPETISSVVTSKSLSKKCAY